MNGASADLCLAEANLRELALVLRRVPVAEHTRGLHLRALRLKRDIERWRIEAPDEPVRRALFDEIDRLRRETAVCAAGGQNRQVCLIQP